MSTTSKGQRITLKRTRPNPLFQDWLEELYEEAQEKKSKLETMLKQALSAISKYPLPLKSGAECIILQGFEKKLCMYLDQRLEVYNYNLTHADRKNNTNRLSQSDTTSNSHTGSVSNVQNINKITIPADDTISLSDNETVDIPTSKTDSPNLNTPGTISEPISPNSSGTSKKSKRSNLYKPTHRSGAYAILVTLLENSLENKPSLTKDELIEKAQKHSEESFTQPKPETFYTAWSNMTRLVTKGLVKKTRSKKVAFSLTDIGVELASELLRDSKTVPTVNDIIFNNEPVIVENDDFVFNDNIEACSGGNVIEMVAGSFDVILLIDKNETGGVSKKNDPTVAQFNKYPELKHEYRSLKVGDFTWIARSRDNKQELVLPYVIERKRMDDLGASIKDGRFHEQKFRLRKCGLDNVIYMVENYGSNKHVGLPLQSLMQSLANTRIQDGFKVHITDSLTNSTRFLAMMTKRLTIRFKDKTLTGRNDEPRDKELMSFEYFNKSSSKTKPLTVTETFMKLLLQLKGLTVEKALAITNRYSTPHALIKAYEKCDQGQGQFLLANLKYGEQSRNVGINVSKSIYQLFSTIGAD